MDQHRAAFAELTSSPGNEKCLNDIEKDLDRQFPTHVIFQSKAYG